MTAEPISPVQLRPLTVAEYLAWPGDPERRYELQEGSIVMTSRPGIGHRDFLGELYVQLRPQVPPHLKMIMEIDLDLHLVAPTRPGTVRVPDLLVVTADAHLRVSRDGGLLRAEDTVLAVEIHSDSTKRTDTAIKHSEYADAGIGHCWMIDPADGPSLTACHLAGEFGYINASPVRGEITLPAPFPVDLSLGALG
ncbi:MAG: Uma2 family endonuclease [Pseudonocardia sp.]|nr:Uma2 family endonuclease [Pseudonocardia sp.]